VGDRENVGRKDEKVVEMGREVGIEVVGVAEMIVGSVGIADSVGTDFEFVGRFGFAEMIDSEVVVDSDFDW
jgi:hypothetical protein